MADVEEVTGGQDALTVAAATEDDDGALAGVLRPRAGSPERAGLDVDQRVLRDELAFGLLQGGVLNGDRLQVRQACGGRLFDGGRLGGRRLAGRRFGLKLRSGRRLFDRQRAGRLCGLNDLGKSLLRLPPSPARLPRLSGRLATLPRSLDPTRHDYLLG
jgi:hypothetical protein